MAFEEANRQKECMDACRRELVEVSNVMEEENSGVIWSL